MTRLIRFSFVALGLGMFVFVAVLHFRDANIPPGADLPARQVAETDTVVLQGEQEVYPVHAVLQGVTDDLSVGVATYSAVGGNFSVMISAQLSPLPAGSVYYGWLVSRAPEFHAISLGQLIRTPEDGNLWEVTFRAAAPLAAYREVWVTKEPEFRSGDEPGPLVLQGEWE